MAKETQLAAGTSKPNPTGQANPASAPVDRMSAARAAKGTNGGSALTSAQKFQLESIKQARRACGMLTAMVQEGQPIPAEVVQACSTLSNALASLLV